MNTRIDITKYVETKAGKKFSHDQMREYFSIAFKGEPVTDAAYQSFLSDYETVWVFGPAEMRKFGLKYDIRMIKSFKRKKSHNRSNELNKYAVSVVMRDVPKQYRRGGRQNSQGVYKGKDKNGKVIFGFNKSDKGRLDTGYAFSFMVFEFWGESKVKDSLRPEQKEFIEFKTAQGHYCCVFRSEEEFDGHWAEFKRLHKEEFLKIGIK